MSLLWMRYHSHIKQLSDAQLTMTAAARRGCDCSWTNCADINIIRDN